MGFLSADSLPKFPANAMVALKSRADISQSVSPLTTVYSPGCSGLSFNSSAFALKNSNKITNEIRILLNMSITLRNLSDVDYQKAE